MGVTRLLLVRPKGTKHFEGECMIVNIIPVAKSGFLKINWYIFYKNSTLLHCILPCLAVNDTELFTLSFERSQQMLRVMLHKGNSYKFVSLFQQYTFFETNLCKNLFCVNSDQAETFQVVKDSVAQLRLQIYMTDRVTNVTERK
jgi:hypothetical protein